MRVLLRLAAEEQVVLIPVLLDFHLADGVVRSGPEGAWQVNDRPDLVTDPRKRDKLVAALEDFVRPFAGDPGILAWDVMNEPENAAAVATPAHYADLQTLMRELVDAVHRAGDLATVGHRNAVDPARFFRGRVATDLGQVHYYPFVDTRPNPTPFNVPLAPVFGPLPAGWGELQARPALIASQLDRRPPRRPPPVPVLELARPPGNRRRLRRAAPRRRDPPRRGPAAPHLPGPHHPGSCRPAMR